MSNVTPIVSPERMNKALEIADWLGAGTGKPGDPMEIIVLEFLASYEADYDAYLRALEKTR